MSENDQVLLDVEFQKQRTMGDSEPRDVLDEKRAERVREAAEIAANRVAYAASIAKSLLHSQQIVAASLLEAQARLAAIKLKNNE